MKRLIGFTGIVTALMAGQLSADPGNEPKLPPPAKHQVRFHEEILPILARRCAQCHAGEISEGGLSLVSRASLMKGGDSGQAVVVGRSDQSLLLKLITGADPDRIMPAEGPRLTSHEIGLVRAWIDQGLAWEDGITLRGVTTVAWEPRSPRLPEGSEPNPIDRILGPYFRERDVAPAGAVDDRLYARRVYLDVIGLPPTSGELDRFLADRGEDKRLRLVRQLLADRRRYAEHWLSFWNDALRNDYRGTGYIDGGRKQITGWLYQALAENKPYDQFVRELIEPAPGAEGFTAGIVWRGVVNASQQPAMQAAQNVSQVFLGINLKCASCHDSFINDWKLNDAYRLAGVFSDEPLEVHRCNQPIGEFVEPAFLKAEMGPIDAASPRGKRMHELARIMTGPENGRLARTIVNRLWARFLGRGLVEPVDEMDNPPFSADLLDWLSVDLVDHNYDLKHTIELVLTSRAYQRPAVAMPELSAGDAFVFTGPIVRRLSAEQFLDALMMLTGAWYDKPHVELPDISPKDQAASAAGVRAALVSADPLMRALGRPNREQVVTSRPSVATTLEALELTNGGDVTTMIRKGARRWLDTKPASTAELVHRIYRESLGRKATESEMAVAEAVVASPPTAEGVEDLLWIVTMLPEFQLIH